MAAPTIYRHSDSSAPTLTGEAGSLNALLYACLVTGYGAKDALGWTREYTSGNTSVYRPASGLRRYLRVVDTGAQAARISGFRTMSDANTGTGQFPLPFSLADANVSGGRLDADGLYARKSITASSLERPWVLIGNDHSFYMVARCSGSTIAGGTLNGDAHIGFGQLVNRQFANDDWHGWIMGAESSATTEFWGAATTQPMVYFGRDRRGGIVVESEGIGYAKPHNLYRQCAGSATDRTSPLSGSNLNGGAYPQLANSSLMISRVRAGEWQQFASRGAFPGLWGLHCSGSSLTDADTFSGMTGTNLASRTFVIVITGDESLDTGVVFETTAGSWDG